MKTIKILLVFFVLILNEYVEAQTFCPCPDPISPLSSYASIDPPTLVWHSVVWGSCNYYNIQYYSCNQCGGPTCFIGGFIPVNGQDTIFRMDNNSWSTFPIYEPIYWAVRTGPGSPLYAGVPCVQLVRLPAALPPVSLMSPPNGAIGVDTMLWLRWSKLDSATSYRVLIFDDVLLGSIKIDTVTALDSILVNMLPNVYYLWHVKPYKSGGEGPFSDVFSFTTLNPPVPPPAPNLVSPIDGAVLINTTPLLEWSYLTTATGYSVQIAKDAQFVDIRFDSTGIINTNITVPFGFLNGDSTYFWRVGAYNAYGNGYFSERSFTIILPSWFTQNSGTNYVLNNVFFVDSLKGWIAGGDPYQYVFLNTSDGGNHWNQQTLPGWNGTAYDVFFADQNTGWVMGSTGYIRKTTDGGLSWVSQSCSYGYYILSIFFTNTETGYFAGGYHDFQQATIYKTTDGGTNWVQMISNVTSELNRVFFPSSATGYASGGSSGTGVIIKTTNSGINWVTLSGTGNNWLYGNYFVNDFTGWAVGTNGTIIFTNNGGTNWSSQSTGTNNTLRSVYFSNMTTGCIVGDSGLILYTSNSGTNWIPQSCQTTNSLNSVIFKERNGWTVGADGTILKNIMGGAAIPFAPALISPVNNATGISLTPILDWSDVPGVYKYRVQLSTVENFSSIIFDDSSSSLSQDTIPTGILSFYTNYYWRISGRNGTGWSLYSSTWNFRTFGLPLQVNLYNPANNSTEQPTNLTFTWYKALQTLMKFDKNDNQTDESSIISKVFKPKSDIDAISGYWFELVSDTVTMQNLVRDTTLSDSTKFLNGLNLGTTYFWRVKAWNEAGWGPFSLWWKFTTAFGPPQPAVLYSPPNNSILIPSNISFKWYKANEINLSKRSVQFDPTVHLLRENSINPQKYGADAITAYWFEIVTDTITLSGLIRDTTLSDTIKVISNLNLSAIYYWRVKAKNQSGWSSFSGWWKLITTPYWESGWVIQAQDDNYRSINFINSQTGWAAANSGNMKKTTNGGSNWFVVNSGLELPKSIWFNGNSGTLLRIYNSPPAEWMSWDGGYNWYIYMFLDLYISANFNSVTYSGGVPWICGLVQTFDPYQSMKSAILMGDGPIAQLVYQDNDAVQLNRIRFTNPEWGWCVGNSGRVIRYIRGSWTKFILSGNLYGVSFPDTATGYVAGEGVMYKTTNSGLNWTQLHPFNPDGNYSDVKFVNNNTGWVACDITPVSSGILGTTNGGLNWTIQWVGTSISPPYELYFADSTTGWAVIGANIIKTDAGGNPSQIGIPDLISPENGTTALPLIPILDWSDVYNATKYRVQLSNDSTFNTTLIDDSVYSASQFTIPSGILSNSTIYYWRVKAGNSTMWSAYCNPWHFRTFGVPNHVILNSPPNNSSGLPVNINFSWYGATPTLMPVEKSKINNELNPFKELKNNNLKYDKPDAISNYWFELVTDTITFSGLIRDSTLSDTTKLINGLNYSACYYWRVKAKNEVGWGQFSNWWKFSTVSNMIWNTQFSGITSNLRSIYFADANSGWICGDNGIILNTTNGGINWIQQNSGVGVQLYDINFANSSTGWTVGTSATILKTTNGGINWFSMSPPPGVTWFNSVFFTDTLTGFITGVYAQYMYILRTSNGGLNWTQVYNLTNTLEKICFPNNHSSLFGYICGSFYDGTSHGALTKTTNGGLNWNTIINGTGSSYLYGTNFIDSLTGWIVGNSGIILFTSNGGNSFITQNSTTGAGLKSTYFLNANSGWAVGLSGSIVSTTNGGTNWFINSSGTTAGLRAAFAVSPNICWAVGDGGVILKTGTSISPPVLIYPLNGANGISVTPTFDWGDIESAAKYRIQISADPHFNSILIDDSSSTISQYTVQSGILNNNSTYYWRASAKTTEWGPFSSIWYFKTGSNPLQVMLFEPQNNSVNQPVNLLFSWYKTGEILQSNYKAYKKDKFPANDIITNKKDMPARNMGNIKAISNYWFELVTDTNSFSNLIRDTSLTDTVKSLSGLNTVTTYYWRVKAKNESGWGQFSNWWKFTTTLAAPSLISPADNSVNVPLTPLLDWNDVTGANSYRVMIAGDSNFTNIFFDTSIAALSQVTVPSGKLNSLTLYYWRVNGTNTNGTGPWSAIWDFTTLNAISAPELISPLNYSIVQTLTPLLDWSDVTISLPDKSKIHDKSAVLESGIKVKTGIDLFNINSNTYHVQIDTDSVFTNPLILDTSGIGISQLTVPAGKLNYAITYYWKVRTSDGINNSPWSVVWNFSTPVIYNENIPFMSGWNLTSIPLQASLMGLRSLFPACNPPAYWFNNGYIPDTNLINGRGYWIEFINSGSSTISGTPVTTNLIPVLQGWNLISAYHNAVSVSSITSNPPGIINSNFFWFNGNQYVISDSLKPGRSYWINVTQTGSLVLPVTADKFIISDKKTNKAKNTDDKSKWITINITDKNGKTLNVYLSKQEFAKDNYILPPNPPEAIPDLRFNSDTYVELLGKSKSHELVMQSLQFPVKLKVNNMNDISMKVKDNVTGNILNIVLIDNKEVYIEDPLTGFSIIEIEIPKVFSLSQNYPNPFNSQTIIKYAVPVKSNVKIVLYNVLGQEVKVLVDETKDAGFYDFRLDAVDFASGVYFYRMQAGSFSEVKKLLLIK